MEDALHRSALKDWKQLLNCVKDPDEIIPENARINAVLELIRSGPDFEADYAIYKTFTGLLPKVGPEWCGQLLVLCLYFLDVAPAAKIIAKDSLLYERLPRRPSLEFEPPMLIMLKEMHGIADQLDLSEPISKNGLTFLKYLAILSKFILEESFPVPTTKEGVKSVTYLLDINPQITEAYIGSLTSAILFNRDSVPTEEFSRLVLGKYLKLRQIPKLVSKMLQAVGNNPDKIHVVELDQVFLADFRNCIVQLPLGQIPELWKTFLFHMKEDVVESPEEYNSTYNVTWLANQLMPIFLEHIPVIDHTFPKSSLDKIVELIRTTMTDVFAEMGGLTRPCLDPIQNPLR